MCSDRSDSETTFAVRLVVGDSVRPWSSQALNTTERQRRRSSIHLRERLRDGVLPQHQREPLQPARRALVYRLLRGETLSGRRKEVRGTFGPSIPGAFELPFPRLLFGQEGPIRCDVPSILASAPRRQGNYCNSAAFGRQGEASVPSAREPRIGQRYRARCNEKYIVGTAGNPPTSRRLRSRRDPCPAPATTARWVVRVVRVRPDLPVDRTAPNPTESS